MKPLHYFVFCVLFFLLSTPATAQFFPLDFGPRAICESSVNVALPPTNCEVAIHPDMIDAGSFSIIGGSWFIRDARPGRLGPGTHTVTLYVQDMAGTRSCSSTVIVEDKTVPVAICNSYVYATMDDPTRPHDYVSLSALDGGSYDNCLDELGYSYNIPSANYWGPQTYTLTMVDGAGNEATCWGTIETRSPHAPNGYCTTAGNTGYEFINFFGVNSPMGDWVSYSGNNGGSLFNTNYRALRAGDGMTISYGPGFVRSSYREHWQVFLDTNRDGDFDDPGELLHRWNGTADNTASVSLPSSFPRYGFSRLRVVMSYGSYVSPCGPGFWGEFEDYAVELLRPGADLPTARARSPIVDVRPEAANDQRNQIDAEAPGNLSLTEPADASLLPAREDYVSEGLTFFGVFPNPANAGREITILYGDDQSLAAGELELINMAGRRVANYTVQAVDKRQSIILPTSLPAGIYLLNRRTTNGRVMAAQRVLIR